MLKFYIETYGCQMNTADSEVVASIVKEIGYKHTDKIEDADIILINTCSIRENAEQKIWHRIDHIKYFKKKNRKLKLVILGCMAERVGEKFFETGLVDIVAGPDAYKSIPRLIKESIEGKSAADINLSTEETYAGICPERITGNSISGFVSITRGCNNFCSYCIVPYVRGRERSRDVDDIVREVRDLESKGYKEITLLGQNVNSYNFKNENDTSVLFKDLLEIVAQEFPKMRIRFSTSHPKDMYDETLKIIAKYDNICNHIHLPVQSGSNKILKLMNRKYTREWYLERVEAIRRIIPGCGLSSDLFSGFSSETDKDHQDTLELIRLVKFDLAYMFKYSEREGTFAHKNLPDDVPEDVKNARLSEMIDLHRSQSEESNRMDVGKEFEVLVEGVSKKSENSMYGKTQQNKVVVFNRKDAAVGDFVLTRITDCTSGTLMGELI